VSGITLSIVSNEITYPILEASANLGQNSTNNTAEYMGLVLSLLFVKILFHQMKFNSFKLYSDSELVVRQMTGVYQVKKPHIAILYSIAESLMAKIKVDISNVEIHHIRRSLNKEADKLANHAKDLQDNTLTVFY
jgi:ribonuclease HI